MEIYNSLEAAYVNMLEDIQDNGISSSPRGMGTKELIGAGFIISNPEDRIISLNEREINPFYLVGNFLWVISQSNDVEFINYYNPRGYNFSDDGKILRGAYGKRIFDMDGVNQMHQAIRELKLDPDSRRALISIHMPQHDWTGSLDTPCTADFGLLIRDNYLTMINHMRSQSAAFVMPYDIFLMTMLHEICANELETNLGQYHHFCNSLHYFDREEEKVNAIIDEYYDTDTLDSLVMPRFKAKLKDFKPLLQFERKLRLLNKTDFDYRYWNATLKDLELEEVLHQIGVILIIKALKDSNHSMEVINGFIDMNLAAYFKQLF